MTPMTLMTMNYRGSLNGCDSWYVSLLLPIIMGLRIFLSTAMAEECQSMELWWTGVGLPLR
jgi:hypothetical protein